MRLFNRKKPEPEVIEVSAPDISQPVQAIVNAMRDRPHTFGVRLNRNYVVSDYERYTVRDRVTGLVAKVAARWSPLAGYWSMEIELPFGINPDERDALVAAGRELFTSKRERMERHQAGKAERKRKAARREWCAKYNVRVE